MVYIGTFRNKMRVSKIFKIKSTEKEMAKNTIPTFNLQREMEETKFL